MSPYFHETFHPAKRCFISIVFKQNQVKVFLIKFFLHFRVIPNNRQNPPSPNERLSKGYRFADIKASAHASHKTHAYISLKQRSYLRNYGLVCNLGKQMAVSSDMQNKASATLIFAGKKISNQVSQTFS